LHATPLLELGFAHNDDVSRQLKLTAEPRKTNAGMIYDAGAAQVWSGETRAC